MGEDLAATASEADDEGYPTAMESDPRWPCHVQEPLLPVFDGVALPSTWSRLRDALDRGFSELWGAHGMPDRHRPDSWVSLHYGRIYVNAHALERLRAAITASTPDDELVPEPLGIIERGRDWFEQRRAGRHRRDYADRLRRAEGRAAPILGRAAALDLQGIDTPELARGPLDRAVWTELLLPWLGGQVAHLGREARESSAADGSLIKDAIRFEQRCSAELGRRFARMMICREASDIVYLTLEERIAALRDPIQVCALVSARRARVESFSALDLPARFWGGLQPSSARTADAASGPRGAIR